MHQFNYHEKNKCIYYENLKIFILNICSQAEVRFLLFACTYYTLHNYVVFSLIIFIFLTSQIITELTNMVTPTSFIHMFYIL